MDALKQGSDTLFILLGAVMVLAMHAGFAFLELGTVRKKNQVNALVKIMVDFSVSTIAYFAVGYGVAYGTSFFTGAEQLAAKNGYDLVKFFFLLTFAAAIPAIISGGIAERARFGPQLIATAVIVGLVGLASASAFAQNGPGITDKEILICSYQPMTGNTSSYFRMGKGADAWFKHVNESGGIHGRKINFNMVDDKYEPARTTTIVQRFVERDKCFAIVAPLGSAPSIHAPGRSARTTTAVPAQRPPPPTGVITTSRSGTSSSSSSAAVPCPAITNGFSNGCTITAPRSCCSAAHTASRSDALQSRISAP